MSFFGFADTIQENQTLLTPSSNVTELTDQDLTYVTGAWGGHGHGQGHGNRGHHEGHGNRGHHEGHGNREHNRGHGNRGGHRHCDWRNNRHEHCNN